jgi:carbon-monoxide dehydrogenase small subunit
MSTGDTVDGVERPTQAIEVTVNGEPVSAEVEPRLKLSDFLREHLDLHSVRVGCEHGVCGACTVSVDGRTAKSCLVYAVQADGSDVVTAEALSEGGNLHPIQGAFHAEHALQCGFCTSGFVMSTRELLAENPDPSREDVEAALADNICRCTGYENIYDAVETAADALAGEGGDEASGGEDGADEPEGE